MVFTRKLAGPYVTIFVTGNLYSADYRETNYQHWPKRCQISLKTKLPQLASSKGKVPGHREGTHFLFVGHQDSSERILRFCRTLGHQRRTFP